MKSLAILIYLHRIVNHIDRHTALLVNEPGLTLSQFAVLEALYHKGDLSIGSIKEAVLSSDGTIPVVIGNLQKQGLVVKETDPKDRRRSIVSLTSKGRHIIEKVYPQNEVLIDKAFACWDEREKRQLIKLLQKYKRT